MLDQIFRGKIDHCQRQESDGQISWLALKAIVGRARTGDGGKGFAMVASEVKSLANQVGSVTRRIFTEIGRMKSVSTDVVDRLRAIQRSLVGVRQNVTDVTEDMGRADRFAIHGIELCRCMET